MPINRPMFEFMLGYNMGQRNATQAATLARSAAAADGVRQTSRVEDLNEKIERLTLAVKAMWALLEEQGMTSDQLIAKMEEIDTSDGERDGLATPHAGDCTACGAKVAAGLSSCQYCGAKVAVGDGSPLSRI